MPTGFGHTVHKDGRPANTVEDDSTRGTSETTVNPEAKSNNLAEAVTQRLDDLLASYRAKELLSTTGMQATIDELVRRNKGLEEAVRTLATELERLSTRFERTVERIDQQPANSYSINHPMA